MPDMERLNQVIEESGMKVSVIAAKTGIHRVTLYHRLKGRGEWKASEIKNISDALHLSKPERDKIFLN